jgi:hypothetical protein
MFFQSCALRVLLDVEGAPPSITPVLMVPEEVTYALLYADNAGFACFFDSEPHRPSLSLSSPRVHIQAAQADVERNALRETALSETIPEQDIKGLARVLLNNPQRPEHIPPSRHLYLSSAHS